MIVAGIETGGTKVICGVVDDGDPTVLLDTIRIPTTTPEQVATAISRFLEPWPGLGAVGLASFGPLDLDRRSPGYGRITSTPKPGWRDVDLPRMVGLTVPYAVTTDVTGSALGEASVGGTSPARSLAYATVGTGVGVGMILGGATIDDPGHPEVGHLLVRRHPRDDFPGNCPFHGDCIEGLAAGRSVVARWGTPDTHASQNMGLATEIIGYYVAQLVATITYTAAPERVILGGGVLGMPGLMDEVRRGLRRILNGAITGHPGQDVASGYIMPPVLGELSGVRGAVLLGVRAAATAVSQDADYTDGSAAR